MATKQNAVYVVRERSITEGLDGWSLVAVLVAVAVLALLIGMLIGDVSGGRKKWAAEERAQKAESALTDLTFERDGWKAHAQTTAAIASICIRPNKD